MHFEEIELVMLRLDLDNYRIYHTKNENDALKSMVQVQGKKIVELAFDIAQHGLSPIEIISVTPSDKDGFHTVLEGNRRITALRLLENPALAGDPHIEKAIAKIEGPYIGKITQLNCCVMPDREDALKWIDRKHGSGLGGASLERWGFVSNARRKADRGEYEKWIAAVDYLREGGDPLEHIELDMDRYDIGSQIDRVFNTAYMREALGVDIQANGDVFFENGDEKSGAILLKTVLTELINSRPTTDELRYVEDRIEYLSQFSELSVKKGEETSKPTTDDKKSASSSGGSEKHGDGNGGDADDGGKKKRKSPARRNSARRNLAPTEKKLALYITQDRINDLYYDLRKLNITDDKGLLNVAGVMIRVFLDLSLTHYLTEKKVSLDSKSTKQGKSSWKDIGVTLPNKLNATLKALDPKSSDASLKPARQAMSKDFHHSIHILHERVHDLDATTSTRKEATECWDRYHPLFQKIYEDLDR